MSALRLAIAKAIASKTYAFATITLEGSDQYDCGEWEEMGCDAQATYLDAADAVLEAMKPKTTWREPSIEERPLSADTCSVSDVHQSG